jgi:hypothetical protein
MQQGHQLGLTTNGVLAQDAHYRVAALGLGIEFGRNGHGLGCG